MASGIYGPSSTRANPFVAAGRWLKGLGAAQRRHPWTGETQTRGYGQRRWQSPNRLDEPKVAHPAAHAVSSGIMASAAIGTGGRIGVGEAIGTGRGTPLLSGSATTSRIGPGGVIGEMRIGGLPKGAGTRAGGRFSKAATVRGGGGG